MNPLKKTSSLLLIFIFILSAELFMSCHKHTCPANNGGVIDKVRKPGRHHKPQSGLWGKEMR